MSDSQEQTGDVETIVAPVATKPRPRTENQPKTRKLPPYHVVILNDEDHTFEYVIELLGKLFGHGVDVAEALAWKIHREGRSSVYTTHKERAELKREQVVAYGPDHRLSSSMTSLACYIEPAEAGG